MDALGVAGRLAEIVLVLVLPASVWGHLLYPRERLAVTFALGLLLMMATLPAAVLVVSWVSGADAVSGLLVMVSAVATLAGLAASLWRMRGRTRRQLDA